MKEGGIPILLSGAPYRPARTIVIGCGGGPRTERAVGAMARLSLWKEAPRGILLAVDDTPEGGQERIAAPRRILADAGYPAWEEKILPGHRAATVLTFCESVDADVVVLGGWGEQPLERPARAVGHGASPRGRPPAPVPLHVAGAGKHAALRSGRPRPVPSPLVRRTVRRASPVDRPAPPVRPRALGPPLRESVPGVRRSGGGLLPAARPARAAAHGARIRLLPHPPREPLHDLGGDPPPRDAARVGGGQLRDPGRRGPPCERLRDDGRLDAPHPAAAAGQRAPAPGGPRRRLLHLRGGEHRRGAHPDRGSAPFPRLPAGGAVLLDAARDGPVVGRRGRAGDRRLLPGGPAGVRARRGGGRRPGGGSGGRAGRGGGRGRRGFRCRSRGRSTCRC